MSKAALSLTALILLSVGLISWARDPIRLRAGEHRGVDVSAHQGLIDWRAVAASGIEFAYIKASEGGDWVDERFRENWKASAAAGLKRGAYHFFTLRRPGLEQAENFLRAAPPQPDSLPPVVDLEFGGNTRARPTREVVVRELSSFLNRVETAHQRPVILYLLPEFEATYAVAAAFPRDRWLRSLLTRPGPKEAWKLWQYTPLGRVAGIQGDVDLNLARDLLAL
ncbi:MAG: GH25 family lysozyme [Vulcanimicrobiota bacterium]